MATPAACVAAPDAAGGPTQAALSNMPGLQLLLRILPFRSGGSNNRGQPLQQHHVVKVCAHATVVCRVF